MEAIGKAQADYQEAWERFRRGCTNGLDVVELDALADDLDKARGNLEVAWLNHHAGASPEAVAQIEREHAEQAREQTRILSAAAWSPENTDPPPSRGGSVQQKVMSEIALVAGLVVSVLNAVQVAALPLPAWAHTIIAIVSVMAGALVVRQNVTPNATPAPAPTPPASK